MACTVPVTPDPPTKKFAIPGTIVPLIVQTLSCPVFEFTQRIPGFPVKLPAPMIRQFKGAEPMMGFCTMLVPFMLQIETCPVAVFRQTRSRLGTKLRDELAVAVKESSLEGTLSTPAVLYALTTK